MALRFAEQLLVLVAGITPAGPIGIPARTLHYGLSGAALLDLALAGRVDTDLESLYLTDAAATNDALLDYVLGEIAREPERRSCEFWVRQLAKDGEKLQALAAARLVAEGTIQADDSGAFSLIRRASPGSDLHRSVRDAAAGGKLHPRLMALLFGDDIPAPEDAALVSLLHACDLFRTLLTAQEYAEVEERIELVAGLDLAGQALRKAIRNLTVAETLAARRRRLEPGSRRWPVADGRLPLLGHAHRLGAGDAHVWFAAQYRKHGPVFEVRAPGKRYLVMAGLEANRFVNREGKDHLRTRDAWASFCSAVGSNHTILALDGADHMTMRRTKRAAYSGDYFTERMPEALAIAQRVLAALPTRRPVVVTDAMRRIVTEQVTVLASGVSSQRDFEHAALYVRALLMLVARKRPRFTMRLPRVRRARRHLELLVERALDSHESERHTGEYRDLTDALLELHRSSPAFMSHADLFAAVLGPVFVGMDTAAITLSFALYALLQHPELMARAQAEADALFAAGEPTAQALDAMSVTRNVLLETMRLYPLGPALSPRKVINTFDFAGYRIPYGTDLLLAYSVTHALPEHFPDPERFDIDRYSPPRQEHRQPGAWVPFGLGHHICLGQGFAQIQMPLVMATLLHRFDLAMDPPGYRLKMARTLGCTPDDRFRVRLRPRLR